MPRISQEEFRRMLDEAATQVEVGGTYVHYKTPEHPYILRSLAILEATEEVAVTYEAQYGEGISYIRPLSNFVELVEWEGEQVPRFQKSI